MGMLRDYLSCRAKSRHLGEMTGQRFLDFARNDSNAHSQTSYFFIAMV